MLWDLSMENKMKKTTGARQKNSAGWRPDTEKIQALFGTLFGGLFDIALIHDEDGIILNVNPAGVELLEWDATELAGRNITEILGGAADHILSSGSKEMLAEDLSVVTYLVSRSGRRVEVDARLKSLELEGESCVLLIARDISERKRESITWQSDLLRKTIDSLAHPFAVIDVNDYRVVTANRAGKELGLDKGTLCYEALYNRDVPCDANETECLVDTIKRTGKPYSYEYSPSEGKEPSEGRHKVSGYPVFDQDGKVAQVISYSLDITSQRRAEVDLRESEERFRSLMDHLTGVSIQGYSTDGTVRYWNKASQQVYGYEAEEAIGRNLAELIIPDNILPLFRQALEVGKKATRSGELMPAGEVMLKHKNGSGVPVYSIHTVVCLEGKENLMFCIDVDLAERKLIEEQLRISEERLRTLFENAPVGLYRTTPEGDLLMSNPAMIEMLGYASFEELRQRNISEGFPDGSSRQDFLDMIEEQGEVENYRSAWLKKNGELLEIEESSKAVRGPGGGTIYYEGIVRDITLISQLEKEHIKASKLESLGLLAGGIAHDFNNLLGALVINLWSVKRSREDPAEVERLIEDSERITQRARELTGQLLTFSKGGEPVKKQVSVAGIVKDTIALSLGGSKIKCELEVCEDLWQVEADQGQLGQVFSNLLINAGQAMPEGGIVRIEIDNHRIDRGRAAAVSPGDYILISVRDNGHGIPGEYLSRIFDPYYTTKQTGSGLGLTTAYSIVKKHGGNISAENNDSGGAAFHILLPASRKSNKETEQSVEADTDIAIESGGLKILIMDDEEIYSSSLKQILTGMGHQVRVADEGRQAIDIYEDAIGDGREFDIVIMDLTIPGGMGGRETIAELKENHPRIKAIVSSGYYDDPVMADFTKYGFSGALAKPFNIEDLVREIKRVVEQ
jgi:PAS domain S-box-containing protein